MPLIPDPDQVYGPSRGRQQFLLLLCTVAAILCTPLVRLFLVWAGPDFQAFFADFAERHRSQQQVVTSEEDAMRILQGRLAELTIETILHIPAFLARCFWGWLYLLACLVCAPFFAKWSWQGKAYFDWVHTNDLTWLEAIGRFLWTFILFAFFGFLIWCALIVISFFSASAPNWPIFWAVPGLISLLLAPVFYVILIPGALRMLRMACGWTR
jgi:hypothetical protein